MSLYEVNFRFMFVHDILFLYMQNTMLDFVNMAFTNCMLTMSVLNASTLSFGIIHYLLCR